MGPRNCRVKQINPDLRLAIGSLQEISQTDDGRAVLLQNLYFLPLPTAEVISVQNDVTEVLATLLEMCLRKSFAIRDTMGNVVDDFEGWGYVQCRSTAFLKGDDGEDIVNKVWYGVEKLLNEVFVNIPYYALAEIHYSVETREIVFIGDYRSATNEYVAFVRYEGTGTITEMAVKSTRTRW